MEKEDIPDEVWVQYDSIRKSGQCDMFMRYQVEKIAHESEFFDLMNAIDEGLYPKIVKHYDKEYVENLDLEIPEAEEVELG